MPAKAMHLAFISAVSPGQLQSAESAAGCMEKMTKKSGWFLPNIHFTVGGPTKMPIPHHLDLGMVKWSIWCKLVKKSYLKAPILVLKKHFFPTSPKKQTEIVFCWCFAAIKCDEQNALTQKKWAPSHVDQKPSCALKRVDFPPKKNGWWWYHYLPDPWCF